MGGARSGGANNSSSSVLVPSVEWFAGDAGQVEATDFDGKMYSAANVFDLIPDHEGKRGRGYGAGRVPAVDQSAGAARDHGKL
jgi:hypothetical protein